MLSRVAPNRVVSIFIPCCYEVASWHLSQKTSPSIISYWWEDSLCPHSPQPSQARYTPIKKSHRSQPSQLVRCWMLSGSDCTPFSSLFGLGRCTGSGVFPVQALSRQQGSSLSGASRCAVHARQLYELLGALPRPAAVQSERSPALRIKDDLEAIIALGSCSTQNGRHGAWFSLDS